MKFTELNELAAVWHLGDFWHVHINAKLDYDSIDMEDFVAVVASKNPGCSVRYSSASGWVMWVCDGQYASPYEPALTSILNKGYPEFITEMAGYDPNNGMRNLKLNATTGDYSIGWDSGLRANGKDFTNLVATGGKSLKWCDNVLERNDNYQRMLALLPEDMPVRYYSQIGEWSEYSNPTPDIHRTDAHEVGRVHDNGRLELIRISDTFVKAWTVTGGSGGEDGSVSIPHRPDGPARVVMHHFKETYSGNQYHQHHLGHFSHRWYSDGKAVDPIVLSDFMRKNQIVVRSGPCADESAFLNEQDQLMWVSAKF